MCLQNIWRKLVVFWLSIKSNISRNIHVFIFIVALRFNRQQNEQEIQKKLRARAYYYYSDACVWWRRWHLRFRVWAKMSIQNWIAWCVIDEQTRVVRRNKKNKKQKIEQQTDETWEYGYEPTWALYVFFVGEHLNQKQAHIRKKWKGKMFDFLRACNKTFQRNWCRDFTLLSVRKPLCLF